MALMNMPGVSDEISSGKFYRQLSWLKNGLLNTERVTCCQTLLLWLLDALDFPATSPQHLQAELLDVVSAREKR